MGITTGEAFAAIRARLDSAGLPFPVYYHGDVPPILSDTPTTFAFVIFNSEGSTLVSFGGGRYNNVYRNRARLESYLFQPAGYGLEIFSANAELLAVQLRSFRNDSISCFQSDVIPIGQGSTMSVPGLSTEVNNYQCALVESLVMFDQVG